MRESGGQSSGPTSAQQRAMIDLITREAAIAGVPASVALATAYLESRFNPDARGDLGWYAKNNGATYRKAVLDKPYFRPNPWRTRGDLWYARGLFQLLPAYHLRADEHPDVLFNPVVNTQRALSYLRGLLTKTGGDPLRARLYYTGAIGGDEELKVRTASRMRDAIARFGGHDGTAA